LSRSVDLVSMRRRLGTLGRFGGGGLRKAKWEGGGDGSLLNVEVEGAAEAGVVLVDDDDEMPAGIIGSGDCNLGAGLSFSRSRSISGNTLDRAADSVSSWNSPALPTLFLLDDNASSKWSSDKSGSSDTMYVRKRGWVRAADKPPLR